MKRKISLKEIVDVLDDKVQSGYKDCFNYFGYCASSCHNDCDYCSNNKEEWFRLMGKLLLNHNFALFILKIRKLICPCVSGSICSNKCPFFKSGCNMPQVIRIDRENEEFNKFIKLVLDYEKRLTKN